MSNTDTVTVSRNQATVKQPAVVTNEWIYKILFNTSSGILVSAIIVVAIYVSVINQKETVSPPPYHPPPYHPSPYNPPPFNPPPFNPPPYNPPPSPSPPYNPPMSDEIGIQAREFSSGGRRLSEEEDSSTLICGGTDVSQEYIISQIFGYGYPPNIPGEDIEDVVAEYFDIVYGPQNALTSGAYTPFVAISQTPEKGAIHCRTNYDLVLSYALNVDCPSPNVIFGCQNAEEYSNNGDGYTCGLAIIGLDIEPLSDQPSVNVENIPSDINIYPKMAEFVESGSSQGIFTLTVDDINTEEGVTCTANFVFDITRPSGSGTWIGSEQSGTQTGWDVSNYNLNEHGYEWKASTLNYNNVGYTQDGFEWVPTSIPPSPPYPPLPITSDSYSYSYSYSYD